MKAIFKDQVIAESDKAELIYIEGNWYFPPASLKSDYFRKSDTPYTCPWKGVCQYFDVKDGESWAKDLAWSYPEPLQIAFERVKKDFSNYVAFDRSVTISE